MEPIKEEALPTPVLSSEKKQTLIKWIDDWSKVKIFDRSKPKVIDIDRHTIALDRSIALVLKIWKGTLSEIDRIVA